MFHALGYWLGQAQEAVRQVIAERSMEYWQSIFPWDDGKEYAQFHRTTVTPGEWGDGRHLALASRIFGVRIAVVGDRDYWFGTNGATWTIRFDARLEHYDVVVQDEVCAGKDTGVQAQGGHIDNNERGRNTRGEEHMEEKDTNKGSIGGKRRKGRSHLGATRNHPVLTLNVGGSREALINAMDMDVKILLIQEHRIAGPGLPGIQGLLWVKDGMVSGTRPSPKEMVGAVARQS